MHVLLFRRQSNRFANRAYRNQREQADQDQIPLNQRQQAFLEHLLRPVPLNQLQTERSRRWTVQEQPYRKA